MKKHSKIKAWVLSFRVKTLTASVVPILVATSLAWVEHSRLDYQVFVLTLLASFFIQIGTNLFNDAIDFKKGADTEERIGPKRVTQGGYFTYKKVLFMAVFFLVMAFLCGVPLVIKGGWPFILIGATSIFLAYGYTGGPFPLAYLGLGDLFVILYFGVISVMGVYYLHTGTLHWGIAVAGLQVGLLATVLLAVNNLRDFEQDRKANKKTLVVRFGSSFGQFEILFLYSVAYILNFYWLYKGFYGPLVLSLLSLPLAIYVVRFVYSTKPSPLYNSCLAKASASHIAFGILFSAGILIG